MLGYDGCVRLNRIFFTSAKTSSIVAHLFVSPLLDKSVYNKYGRQGSELDSVVAQAKELLRCQLTASQLSHLTIIMLYTCTC